MLVERNHFKPHTSNINCTRYFRSHFVWRHRGNKIEIVVPPEADNISVSTVLVDDLALLFEGTAAGVPYIKQTGTWLLESTAQAPEHKTLSVQIPAIFQTTFSDAFYFMKIYKFWLKFNNIPALVEIMAWRRPGDKPLSEPMMVTLLTHICVTPSQWV